MADLEKLRAALGRAEMALAEMRALLAAGPTQTGSFDQGSKPAVVIPTAVVAENATVDQGSFEYLSQIVRTDQWPDAVNASLICDPTCEEDKLERSRGIMELMIQEDLKGRRFLDYGCGEGHSAFMALEPEYGVEVSVGFDIETNDCWPRLAAGKDNLFFTNSYHVVQDKGPYHVILLFDVIDHLKEETAVAVLQKAKNVLADNGAIYMRTHPFTSRHATHLYHDLNKAYLHLVFTPEELRVLIPHSKYEEQNNGVTTPLKTYTETIAAAGLTITERRDVAGAPEPFFRTPAIAQRIMKGVGFNQYPEFQMSMQFFDWILKR